MLFLQIPAAKIISGAPTLAAIHTQETTDLQQYRLRLELGLGESTVKLGLE